MSKRLEEIVRRKQALIARCAEDRMELTAACKQIRGPIHIGTLFVRITKALKTYPLIAAGVSSLLVSGYGGKLTRSAFELLQLWKLLKPIGAWWTKRRKPA